MAEMTGFLDEILATRGGERVLQCYQCGTCSGSCPVLAEMDYGPRRIMHMISMGQEEEVLSSPDIWYCVSCYSCANRCPRDIEVTDVMATLRSTAVKKGYTKDPEAKLGRAFANTIRQHGRSFEVELMIRFYASTLDVLGLLGMTPLALKMLSKGKLSFVPKNIKDTRTWRKVFGTAGRREEVA
jgi:heterodisulfide reductase subunit C